MEEWLAGKDVDLLVDDDDSVDYLTKEKTATNGSNGTNLNGWMP